MKAGEVRCNSGARGVSIDKDVLRKVSPEVGKRRGRGGENVPITHGDEIGGPFY